MQTLILSHQNVVACLPYEDVIGMVDTVFVEWGRGNVVMPPKVNLDMARSGFGSWANAMPAYVASHNVAGLKWVGGYATNPARGMPYIMGVVVLTDPETGGTLAVMDGVHISDWRTGASAAVAARYLATDKVGKIAMVGAGAQGRTATVCLHQLFPSATITVADISPERRRAFQAKMNEEFGIAVADSETVEYAVRGADVAVLLTTAQSPIVRAEWIAPGCVALAMGSYQQADDALILGSDKIVVDCWGQAAHRGELKALADSGRISEKDVHAELGAIAAGSTPGRRRPEERILCVLVGLGAHDVFIAGQVYQRAVERGLGQKVRLR